MLGAARPLVAGAVAALLCFAADTGKGPKFYPDDPIWTLPAPLPVDRDKVNIRKIDQLYDFATNSIAPPGEKQLPGKPIPAKDVNTVDELPDSMWYTNRHRTRRMTVEEMKRGSERGNAPAPPFMVVGAKTDGISPGFQMMDANGRRYLCKPDPRSNPELSTAADVIGSKFFYAFGYNTPENYIVYFKPGELKLDPKATTKGLSGKERRLNHEDIERVLREVPRDKQGRLRVSASLFIPGKGVGPFRWYGVRTDDPDDIILHEHRRSLRGLHVLSAWVNHTDVKANNTYDSILPMNGVPVVVHFLIDFSAMLGSDSDEPKDARFGHDYMIEKDKKVLLKMATLGLYSPDWERASYPGIRSVGRFEAETFDPEKWLSNYPNSAYINRLPDDNFWAAKQVMAFTREEIRAMVESGQYTDERAVGYLVSTLEKRQRKIGEKYFAQVLPLDGFTVEGGTLRFEDLGIKYKFVPSRDYKVQWSTFDNSTGARAPIAGASGFGVPSEASRGYVVAEIQGAEPSKMARVYLNGAKVVGIDRTW